jgi:hypothetical protein
MIPPTQREALSVLAEVVDLSPDIRLGQLLAHLGFLGENQVGQSLGYIDDEQLLAVLYHHLGELTARVTDAPLQTTNDPIVDEVRRIRDAHAASFNYDLDAIFQDIKRQEKESGLNFVNGVARQLVPTDALRPPAPPDWADENASEAVPQPKIVRK